MEATIYSNEGKKDGTIALPVSVFGVPFNNDSVHQVVTAMRSSARAAIAHTKTRGEVRGGGKKPWAQKGTGRARHGSTRSPIWVGGGVAHGPRNDKNYDRKINKTLKNKVLAMILSKKFKMGEVLFVSDLTPKNPKAKDGKAMLASLSKVQGFDKLMTKRNNAAYIALGEKKAATVRSLQNFGHITLAETRNMSPIDLLDYKYIVIANPKESVAFLEAKMN